MTIVEYFIEYYYAVMFYLSKKGQKNFFFSMFNS